MASYCTVGDVQTTFPQFTPGLPNNVSTADIQNWIDEAKADIRGLFVERAIDPDALIKADALAPGTVIDPDVPKLLSLANRDGALKRLMEALQMRLDFKPSGNDYLTKCTKRYDAFIKAVQDRRYDALFEPPGNWQFPAVIARHRDIRPILQYSIGGAETDFTTPEQRGENRAFGRDQVF